jgi:hypothetical protein
VHETLQKATGSTDEPMLNIICSYQEGEWRVMIFPRAKHRPAFFFAEGDNKILISPAAVDFGGVVITPLEQDFRKLMKEHLIQMFDEVSIATATFATIANALTTTLPP